MKSQRTETGPKFNLMKPDGVRSQGHAEDVTDVLLNDGRWYEIVPGSFKFYKTNSQNGVPFVCFDTFIGENENGFPIARRVEVFPASVAGLAYTPATSVAVTEENDGE